jgi:copper resistance protein B
MCNASRFAARMRCNPVLAATLALWLTSPALAQHEHEPAAEQAPAEAGHDHAAHTDHAAGEPAPDVPHAAHDYARASATPTVTPEQREEAFPDVGSMPTSEMMIGDPLVKLVRLDRIERASVEGDTSIRWDLDAWVGHDRDKLWLRSEGERLGGRTESAWLEAAWGRAFSRWWTFTAGARHDFQPGAGQSWLAAGIRGLAPYRLELDATAYVGDGGRAALRVKTEYELLVTNRLFLQPLFEARWYSSADPLRGHGSGFADAELGLRLRYEIRREIAPYVGLVRERRFGGTADLAGPGVPTDDTRLVAGLRLWF